MMLQKTLKGQTTLNDDALNCALSGTIMTYYNLQSCIEIVKCVSGSDMIWFLQTEAILRNGLLVFRCCR